MAFKATLTASLALAFATLLSAASHAQPPALPSGLGSAPALPSFSSAPPTPTATTIASAQQPSTTSVDGFVEWRSGGRLHSDPRQKRQSINELRLQLGVDSQWQWGERAVTWRVAGDLLIDTVDQQSTVSLNSGSGPLDLREAWLQFSPAAALDVKLGRQILTWGSGDLLFINDLFSKDWQSFFSGRDSEYLKAPSDAVKVALFADAINLDLVWLPEFDADRYIDGNRISYYNPMSASLTGRDDAFSALLPKDQEWALRAYKNLAGLELAGYAYKGFWKSPNSVDSSTGLPTFSALTVIGASLRGTLAGGIGNIEVGRYRSNDDAGGDNPTLANSQLRLLLGFEHELANNLTASYQFYMERTEQYRGYLAGLPASQTAVDRDRTLLTNRLSYLTHNQNVSWSLFSFYSPSDEDFYLRPNVSWKINDQLRLEGGFNLFGGRTQRSFFGQFEDTSNAYIAARISF